MMRLFLLIVSGSFGLASQTVGISCDPTEPKSGCRSLTIERGEAVINSVDRFGRPISREVLGRYLSLYQAVVLEGEVPVQEVRFSNGVAAVLTWGFPEEYMAAGFGVICNVYIVDSSGKVLLREVGELTLISLERLRLADTREEALLLSTQGGSPIAISTKVWLVRNRQEPRSVLSIHGRLSKVETSADGTVERLIVDSVKLGQGSMDDRWFKVSLVWNAAKQEFTPEAPPR